MSSKVLLSSVKNEGPFLLEWVAYHRAIGFDRIVVAFNDCDDGSEELLLALDRLGWIEAVPNPVDESDAPQRAAAPLLLEKAAPAEGDWLLWLDSDEFLNIHTGARRLPDLIDAIGDADGMLVNWRVFGDGNGRFTGMMLDEPFTMASEPGRELNSSVKTLFRYGPHIERLDIHRPILNKAGGRYLTGTGMPGKPTARSNRAWFEGAGSRVTARVSKAETGWALAQINHYAVRDEEFFKAKLARGRGYKAAKKPNARHGDDYWAEFNLNDVEDRSILHWQTGTRALMDEAQNDRRVSKAMAKVKAQMPGAEAEEMARPELTFPPEVADWVRSLYASARVILEYGSGGSTVLAAEMEGKTVFSVESDQDWAARLQLCLDGMSPPSMPKLHWVDIGKTKAWGKPRDDSHWASYPDYPLSVWDRDDFVVPDLVLVDGRFRAACFASVMMRTTQPVTLLFDDYTNRPAYHVVEEWLSPVETRGRMARFEIQPRQLAAHEIRRFVGLFSQVL